jgi:hypothetical protein
MSTSFAEHLRALLRQRVEVEHEDIRPDRSSALVEFDRQIRDHSRRLQAQSPLRFHLGQWIRVLAWRLDQLARFVSS